MGYWWLARHSYLFSEISRRRALPSGVPGVITSKGPVCACSHSRMFAGPRIGSNLSRNASNLRQSSSASLRMGSSLSRMPSASERRSSIAHAKAKLRSSDAAMVVWGKSSENKPDAGNGSYSVCRISGAPPSPSPDEGRSALSVGNRDVIEAVGVL